MRRWSCPDENYIKQSTVNFTLDDWNKFIEPLINIILSENENITCSALIKKSILSGILVGLGNIPLDAIKLVEDWEQNQDINSLRRCKMNRYFDTLD